MNDVERLRKAYWHATGCTGPWSRTRPGLLAVLREMREQGGFLLAASRATWQGRIDVLIAQAEASESKARERILSYVTHETRPSVAADARWPLPR